MDETVLSSYENHISDKIQNRCFKSSTDCVHFHPLICYRVDAFCPSPKGPGFVVAHRLATTLMYTPPYTHAPSCTKGRVRISINLSYTSLIRLAVENIDRCVTLVCYCSKPYQMLSIIHFYQFIILFTRQ